MSIETLINYLLYVVPGFFTVEIYRSRYPAKRESDFGRLIWSIFYSIVILVSAKWMEEKFQFGFYPNGNSVPLLTTLLYLFFLAGILGFIRIFWHIGKIKLSSYFSKLEFLNPDPISTWALVNNVDPPEWVIVTLKDGSHYLGWISDWTFDPDSPENDFLLKDARLINKDLETIREINGIGVYLRSSNVSHIEFHRGSNKE